MKKIILFSLLIVIAAAGVWFGRTPYRNWKQRHFLAQAQESLAKSDYRKAVLSARKTLEANPANIEACRVMALITEQFRFSEAIFWRNRILDLEPNVVGNRLALARTALLLGNTGEADQALHGVKESDRNQADFHEIAALLAVAENNVPAAEAQAAAAAKLEPGNKNLQLNLAVLDVQSRNQQLVQAATKSLEELSAEPAFRREALRQLALAAVRDSNYVKAESLSEKLLEEQPVEFNDQILNLGILKEGKSKYFPVTLNFVEKQVATNAVEINALSGWLAGQQMTDESLRWLLSLPVKTREESPVAVAIADCYGARHDWAKMQSFLWDTNWADLEFLRLALLSRALRGQQNDLAAQANWHAAITSASGHQQPLATLTRMANSWGWDTEKVEAAWLLIQRFPGERWALQMLDRYYTTNNDTRGLQKVYAAAMEIDHSDVMSKNNFAAVSLLLGMRSSEAHEMARENYARFPQNPIIASTYAYSLHLQGHTQDGLNVLEKLPKESLRLPSVATYYGILLAAAGQPVKARDYLEIAGRSNLLPEERTLVAAARHASPVRVK